MDADHDVLCAHRQPYILRRGRLHGFDQTWTGIIAKTHGESPVIVIVTVIALRQYSVDRRRFGINRTSFHYAVVSLLIFH